MHILGINAYHADSAACLVRDGALVAAAEEERFCRIKHWAGFPSQAIRYCLAEGGIADVPLAGLGGTVFLSAKPRQITLPRWAVRMDGGKTQGRSWKHPKS